MKVCVDKKKCARHWGAERRAAASRAKEAAKDGGSADARWKKQQERERQERARREAERARWEQAGPALVAACATAAKSAPVAQVLGVVSSLVRRQHPASFYAKHVKPGGSLEMSVRGLAFVVLADAATGWWAEERFKPFAKAFGIDARAIVDKAAPRPKAKPEPDGKRTR